jgi:lysozyme
MRSITERGLQLIKQHEGCYLTPYLCPAGYPTIGYGHLIAKEERAVFSKGIDEQTALKLLAQDVRRAELAVVAMIRVALTDNQFSSLVSFTFNLGSASLQRSTLRCIVNREEHEAVPTQIMRWIYAGGRRLKGLIIRRAAEANLYMS